MDMRSILVLIISSLVLASAHFDLVEVWWYGKLKWFQMAITKYCWFLSLSGAAPCIRQLCSSSIISHNITSMALHCIAHNHHTDIPLLKIAPFLSGGGYSSEAMAFMGALNRINSTALGLPFRLSFSMFHHGDSPSQQHIDTGMSPTDMRLLQDHYEIPADLQVRKLLSIVNM